MLKKKLHTCHCSFRVPGGVSASLLLYCVTILVFLRKCFDVGYTKLNTEVPRGLGVCALFSSNPLSAGGRVLAAHCLVMHCSPQTAAEKRLNITPMSLCMINLHCICLCF
ncbi:hypothetical protein FKM82_007076 [Ascaphus truei]